MRYFNPRSREGSDLCFLQMLLPRWYFNPRSREGSDPNKYIPLTALCMDFNPRSCEGSDDTGISQSTIST